MGQEAVGRARAAGILVALGLFVTGLNAFKPLTVDDSVYYLFAVHIAEHPPDPYGFRAWGVQDANTILAPPVMLYWWAASVRLFGQDPILWKLALLPFNLLLVFALHALGRRFARGLELPFVCFVALSGTVLPCVNLMLDIPALALGLLGVLLFLRACDSNSPAAALAAGVIAGIAAQTKYTAFVAPAVMLLYGFQSGKWRLGLLASTLCGLLFVAWEALVARRYGDSHFWLGCMQFREPPSAKFGLVMPLLGYVGSTIAAGLPFALAALGRSARVIWAVAGLVALVFGAVAVPPNAAYEWLRDSQHVNPSPTLVGLLFELIGFGQFVALTIVAYRLLRRPLDTGGLPAGRWYSSVDGFLIFWLLLEIAGYFALSPYPAARRILGVAVIGMLLVCRQAARTCGSRPGLIWGIVGFNFLLGLLLFAVDFNWYYGQKVMARDLAGECRKDGPAGIWYFGNGAFEFYGDRLGMKRLIAPESAVSPGDWVLVAEGFDPAFSRHPISSRCVFHSAREWNSALPVRSQYQYGNVAVQRQEGPIVRVALYRVR